MPCNSSNGMGKVSQSDIEELKRKNDELTRMLCWVLNAIFRTSNGLPIDLPTEVTQWWEKHQLWDRTQGRT